MTGLCLPAPLKDRQAEQVQARWSPGCGCMLVPSDPGVRVSFLLSSS